MEKSKELLNEITEDLELLEVNGGGLISLISSAFRGNCSWGNMFTPDKGNHKTPTSVPR